MEAVIEPTVPGAFEVVNKKLPMRLVNGQVGPDTTANSERDAAHCFARLCGDDFIAVPAGGRGRDGGGAVFCGRRHAV